MGGRIQGFTITDPSVLAELTDAIGDYPADGLYVLMHTGPNQVYSNRISSWDAGSGTVLVVEGPAKYQGYMNLRWRVIRFHHKAW